MVSTVATVLTQTTSAAPAGAGLQTSQVTLDAIAAVDSASTVAQLAIPMTAFFNQYGVEFHYDCTGIDTSYYGCAPATDLDFSEVKLASQWMIQEWSKYTARLVNFTDLERVYIVGDVRVEITGINQARAAVPDVQGKNMIYDHGYTNTEEYFRSVLHHEYAHYFEYGVYGQLNDTNRPDWIALNDPNFEYGDGGAVCYNGGCPTGEHVVEGFVTGYATSSAAEDFAETFAYMFTTTQYARMNTWLADDSILANKVAMLREEILGVDSTANAAYFTALHDYYNVTFAGGSISLPAGEGTGTGSGTGGQAPGVPNTGARSTQSVAGWIIALTITIIAAAVATVSVLVVRRKNN